MNLRSVYHSILPYEARYWLYKVRHPKEFERLRSAAHVHPKATFSLRGFDRTRSIFVHITKSAGTSLANSLYGELPYHYTAVQYRVIFGRRDFDAYFKFAFVRNPWDRLYSAYSYLAGGGWDQKDQAWFAANLSQFRSFDSFVMEWLTPARRYSHIHFWPQSRFICDHRGRILIDYLGRFESIEDDFIIIKQRVNPSATLEHTNRSARQDYRAAYTPETFARVRELYADDVELLGFEDQAFELLPGATATGPNA